MVDGGFDLAGQTIINLHVYKNLRFSLTMIVPEESCHWDGIANYNERKLVLKIVFRELNEVGNKNTWH